MSEFLAPLNYDRAREALCRLSAYGGYDEQKAGDAMGVLRECYPLVFSKTKQERFPKGSVLLHLQGASVTDPLIFTGHLDVPDGQVTPFMPNVPDIPLSVPMSRAHVVALLEALEELLRDGYCPGGDLFLALSMDGLSGAEGARAMADYLQKLNIKPCFVLDYGGYATMESFRSYLPANVPLALIGVAEKGLLMGQVEAEQTARGDDPAARLLQGGARLTRRPRQASLCTASRRMLEAIGRKTPGFFKRAIMLHPGLFFPLLRCRWHGRSVFHQFFLSELTVYHLAAYGEPASPARRGELRFRQTVIPGQKTARFRQRLRRRLKDPALLFHTQVEYEHSRLSAASGEAWDALETAIEIQFERAVIAPCLCPFITDSRFYAAAWDKVYRFSPFLVTGEEALSGLCTVTDPNLQTAVQFFRSMLSV